MADDLVQRLREGNHSPCTVRYNARVHGTSGVYIEAATGEALRGCDLCEERLTSADALEQLQAQVERLQNPGPCGCRACFTPDESMPFGGAFSRMFVCEHCGNKRCPHATDHRNDCTGSNEPNQPGSAYQYAGSLCETCGGSGNQGLQGHVAERLCSACGGSGVATTEDLGA